MLQNNATKARKLLAALPLIFLLSGCFQAPAKPSAPAQPAVNQPAAADVNLGAVNDLLKPTAATTGGSTYSNKAFGFEVWHPAAMSISEHTSADGGTITIASSDPASSLRMDILVERNPKTTFASLPGKLTVLNDTLMKRLPVDPKDPQKTNTYLFEKNATRVTLSLGPGNSADQFLFPDIVQSFKFTK